MPPSKMIHAISPAGRRAARSAKAHCVLVQASTIAGALNVKGLTQACHYVAMRTAWFNFRRPNCCALRSRSLIVAGVRRNRKPSGMSPPAESAQRTWPLGCHSSVTKVAGLSGEGAAA
jgi:hypothetical protein